MQTYGENRRTKITNKTVKEMIKNKDYKIEDILNTLTSIGHCPNLIFDDNGYWTISSNGIQTIRTKHDDLETQDFIQAKYFKPTIRKAIEYYIRSL